jgi:hypothetical protein
MELRRESTNRQAVATFWCAFHHDGNSAYPGEDGGVHCTPPPFTLSTITSKAVVFAPAERAGTHLLFLLYTPFSKYLVAVCHSFCLFFIFYNIHTIIQSHSYNTFAEASLHLLIACKLSGTDLPVEPSPLFYSVV